MHRYAWIGSILGGLRGLGGTSAKVTAGVGTAVVAGGTVAVIDEAVRGGDSVLSRGQQNIAEANAAELAAGSMGGFKETIANWLNFFAEWLGEGSQFGAALKGWEGKLRENIKRTPQEKTILEATGEALSADPTAALTYGAAMVVPGIGATYVAHRMFKDGSDSTKPTDTSKSGPKGKGGAGFETPSEHGAAKANGQMDMFEETAEKAVRSKGWASSIFGRVGKHLGVVGAVAAPILAFAGTKAMGATNDQATTAATDAIPFKDAFVNARDGNYEDAAQSAVVEGVSWGAFAVGAGTGMSVGAGYGAATGATIGAFFGGVGAAPGAAIGGFVGGAAGFVGGGLVASGVAGAATNAVWEAGTWAVNGITGFFSKPAPEPTPVAALENMNAQFEAVAMDASPATPDYSSAWGNQPPTNGGQRRSSRGMSLTPVTA